MAGMSEARPCACGGEIRASSDGVKEAVEVHQQTPQHRAWSEREYPRPPERVGTLLERLDAYERRSA